MSAIYAVGDLSRQQFFGCRHPDELGGIIRWGTKPMAVDSLLLRHPSKCHLPPSMVLTYSDGACARRRPIVFLHFSLTFTKDQPISRDVRPNRPYRGEVGDP